MAFCTRTDQVVWPVTSIVRNLIRRYWITLSIEGKFKIDTKCIYATKSETENGVVRFSRSDEGIYSIELKRLQLREEDLARGFTPFGLFIPPRYIGLEESNVQAQSQFHEPESAQGAVQFQFRHAESPRFEDFPVAVAEEGRGRGECKIHTFGVSLYRCSCTDVYKREPLISYSRSFSFLWNEASTLSETRWSVGRKELGTGKRRNSKQQQERILEKIQYSYQEILPWTLKVIIEVSTISYFVSCPTRWEFFREILYKNIAIIAIQHSKMYFINTFGKISLFEFRNTLPYTY